MKKNKKPQKGFTLIEVIIYIGLSSLLLTGVIVSTYALIDANKWFSKHVDALMAEIKLLQNRQGNNKQRGGYITIVSAIIISVALVTLMLDQSTAGFQARFAVLDYENQIVSERLAFSCAEIVRLKMKENAVASNTTNYGDCEVKNISRTSEMITFDTSGTYQKFRTDLHVELDPTNFRIVKYLLQ